MCGRVFLLAAVLGLSAPLPAAEPQVLVWRGCSIAKVAFMERCAQVYEEDTGIQVRLSGGGAALGIEAAASGGADLGGTCRACLKRLHEDQWDVKLAIVAWDALVAVVHPDNPVDNLTQAQLRSILQERIRNWKEVGGRDEPIVIIDRRGKTSGVGYSMRQLILGDPDFDYSRFVVRLNDSAPVEELVERQSRALAITGVSSAQKRKIKVLTIDGHAPTPENIASGAYPYFRPLYIAYKPASNPGAAEFVAWLLSDRGQAVVGECGTVTVAQGARLAKMYKYYEDVRQIANFATLTE